MEIEVKSSNSIFKIECGLPITASELASKAAEHLHVPASHVRIFFHGSLIENEKEVPVKIGGKQAAVEVKILSDEDIEKERNGKQENSQVEEKYQARIKYLTSLGFGEASAKEALLKSDYDIDKAVSLLLVKDSNASRTFNDDQTVTINLGEIEEPKEAVWSDEEKSLLLKKTIKYGKKWDKIAKYFPERQKQDVIKEWNSEILQKISLIREKGEPYTWTEEEDEILKWFNFAMNGDVQKISSYFVKKPIDSIETRIKEICRQPTNDSGSEDWNSEELQELENLTKEDLQDKQVMASMFPHKTHDAIENKYTEIVTDLSKNTVWSEQEESAIVCTLLRDGNNIKLLKERIPEKPIAVIAQHIADMKYLEDQQKLEEEAAKYGIEPQFNQEIVNDEILLKPVEPIDGNVCINLDDTQPILPITKFKRVDVDEGTLRIPSELQEEEDDDDEEEEEEEEEEEDGDGEKKRTGERRPRRKSLNKDQMVKWTKEEEQRLMIYADNPDTNWDEVAATWVPPRSKRTLTNRISRIRRRLNPKVDSNWTRSDINKLATAIKCYGLNNFNLFSFRFKKYSKTQVEFQFDKLCKKDPMMEQYRVKAVDRTKPWSEDEIRLFFEKSKEYCFDWERITPFFPDRTLDDVIAKFEELRITYPKLLTPEKTKKWTNEEIALLRAKVERFGTDWKKISGYFPGRTTSSIKQQWDKCSKLPANAPWTEDEKELLQIKVNELGDINHWWEIAKSFPGRTAADVEFFWYANFPKKWPKSEEKQLKDLVKEYGPKWEIISGIMQKSPAEIDAKWAKIDNESETKKRRFVFTPEEDARLISYVKEYGTKWQTIQSFFPSRAWESLKKRWMILKSRDSTLEEGPSINREAWTPEDDEKLIQVVNKYGTNWEEIMKFFPEVPQGTVSYKLGRLKKKNPHLEINSKSKPYTEDEIRLLEDKVVEYGEDFDKIAQFFTTRDKNSLMLRWRRTKPAEFKSWNPKERKLLKEAYEKFGDDWNQVSAFITTRTPRACQMFYKIQKQKEGTVRNWTKEEDNLLIEKAKVYGTCWKQISEFFPDREPAACTTRFKYLKDRDPTISAISARYSWSEQEELRLIDAVEKHGTEWSKLTQYFPERTVSMLGGKWAQFKRGVSSYPDVRERLQRELNFIHKDKKKATKRRRRTASLDKIEVNSDDYYSDNDSQDDKKPKDTLTVPILLQNDSDTEKQQGDPK